MCILYCSCFREHFDNPCINQLLNCLQVTASPFKVAQSSLQVKAFILNIEIHLSKRADLMFLQLKGLVILKRRPVKDVPVEWR